MSVVRFESHECRWFFPGPLDGEREREVVAAFRGAGRWPGAPGRPEPEWPREWRTDRYVCLPAGVDPAEVDMGIKLRDERAAGGGLRLEYKARSASFGPVSFARGVVGLVERWIKWSYADTDVPAPLLAPFLGEDAGIRVLKTRIVRLLRLGDSDRDEEVAFGTRVDRGLAIELAKVRPARHGEHWTLGLEAFPHDAAIHEDLLRTAGSFLSAVQGTIDPTAERSMSYPEWLSRLVGRAEGR